MSEPLSPTARALYGAIGSHRRWGQTLDRSGATKPAREAFRGRFEAEVRADFPEATDQQVRLMAESRRREFYLRLAAKSVASRRRKSRAAP